MSCYFSIASSLVDGVGGMDDDDDDYNCDCQDDDYDDRDVGGGGVLFDDFLLHDVLTSVMSYLDGRSLAALSETARHPSLGCFYFLELQLQLALLALSFEVSIARTSVVSRLASLDVSLARDVVRAYLHSNAASTCAMPLRHSLAYFRQLLSGHANATNFAASGVPHIPENMARGARNGALLLTLPKGGWVERTMDDGERQQWGGMMANIEGDV